MTCTCVPYLIVNGQCIAQLNNKDIDNLRQRITERIESGDTSFIHKGYIENDCPEHPQQVLILE